MKIAEDITAHIQQKKLEELSITDTYKHWSVNYAVLNEKHKFNLQIIATKPYTGSDFVPCSLRKDNLLSILSRYPNFKIKGESSIDSDLLFSDSNALSILMNRNARLDLEGRTLLFSCAIRMNGIEKISQIIDEFHLIIQKLQNRDVLGKRNK